MSLIKKTDHFYLIDGSGYIFRAYYALPPLSRKSDGLPTGAVNGFCTMLYKLLEDSRSDAGKNKPTHFVVIFDSARKNFRNEIYKDYKANRTETPEDLAPQFEYIRKSVEAFNVTSTEMLNYEADDLIATYTDKIIKKGAKVTIVSGDKDLMQLVKPGVRLYDPMKSRVLGNKEVKEKFGVEPSKVVDVQALAGDSSDNVPGVPGIGIKTAAELINKYKSLETLLEKAHEIPQNKRRETILENKNKAILSRKLVELKNDVPVKQKIETFTLKKINKEKLYDFLREMEFNRLLSQVISRYGETFEQKVKNLKKTPIFDLKKYQTILKINQLEEWIKKIEEKGIVAVDTETSSLNPHEANLVGISLCSGPGTACYIPLEHITEKVLEKKIVLKKLKNILQDKSIKKIGQNIKFDFIILLRNEIKLDPIEDTMLMSYALDAGKHRHNMDNLSETHLNHKPISFKEVAGTGKKQISFNKVPIKLATQYAAEDADVTFRLYTFFRERLDKEKLLKIYELFEKPMVNLLSQMEIEGIKINSSFLKELSKKFDNKIKKLEKEIFSIAKREFNIGSPKQLGEILYNELKIAKIKKTKKGGFATSAAVLEDLAFTGHKLPRIVLDWRQLTKLKNTYTDALPEHLNANTNRVHTSFLLAATTTGRLASSEPNLQNIPIKTEDGKEIRKAFIAERNHSLISADYNQIEMRILADIADVKELKKAFKNNEDVHSLTASQVFDIPLNKIDKETRRRAKAINFGIIYGISQYGLAKQISVSNSEAAEFLKSYFKKFPEIKDYMNATINFCRKSGYVNNIFGRRCYITGINDKNYNVRNFQERAAINAPIQGSAADIMRLAMIKITSEFEKNPNYKTKMLLQIHDELVFETPQDELEKIVPIIKKNMLDASSSEHHQFTIPLTVDINSGNNWGEAH
ncbi:MAG: DNA polymerase I [Pelagibacteraceae bacterium]|jgi:DNA polymerase-1|nr:DNA polymerase I [Pelagibacteraceae bacterium]